MAIHSDGLATTVTGIWHMSGPVFEPIKARKDRNEMTLYKVYMVDIRRAVVTSEHTRIGRDEGDAAVGMVLTEEEKKLKSRDELEILWQDVGSFEKLKRSRVVMEKDE